MLQFILGRAGSGKTEYLRRALADRALSGDSKCIMLVPEQFTFETEKAMLRLAGPQRAGAIGVYSFTRLAESVFHRLGGLAGHRLTDGGRRILMSSALAACEEGLEVYRSAVKSGRMTELMLTAVDELKMCGITPEDLTGAAMGLKSRGLAQKLRELSAVYAAYDALVAASYLDSRDDLTRLYEALEGADSFSGCTVAVDSFEGFTQQELKVLSRLMTQADRVLVSLCTDGLSKEDAGLFALVDRTRRQLTAIAGEQGVEVLPPVTLIRSPRFHNENLKLLEAQIFCPEEVLTSPDHEGLTLYRARDVFDESEFVAASIRRLVMEGLRYKDITIICRNPSQYYGSLDVALKKRDIPCFMSQPVRVDAEPVTRFLLGAFEAVQNGLATEELLELLKTGVSGFRAAEISDLENYAYLWRLSGPAWRESFARHPRGFGWEMTEEDGLELSRLNALRARLVPPLEAFAAATADCSGAEMSQACYDLLISFGLEETLPEYCRQLELAGEDAIAARQLRVWDLLMEILDQLHSILGDRRTTRERYYRLLKEVLSAEDVSDIPETADQVIFGTAEQVRQTAPRVVFLMGVTQGDFPQNPKAAGVFSDAERRELIELRLPLGDPLEQRAIEERYLAYSVACLASEGLILSWPMSAGGEDKEPSELIVGVRGVFPTLRPEQELPESFFANSREAAFSRMAARWRERTPAAEALRRFVREDPGQAGRLEALERAAGQRPQRLRDPALAKRVYGERIFLSPTQIETFHSCPFKYFCRYGLNARERRPAEVDVLQYGTLMHYLLEKVFSQPREVRGGWTEDELRDFIDRRIEEYAGENLGGMEQLSSRQRYRLGRMGASAHKLIRHLELELAQSQFVPEHTEMKLGRDAPTLRVETGDGDVVTVGGTIDRVDVLHYPGERSYVRVIDYKTGGKDFRLGDVLYGLNMQMLIYLAALVQDGRRFPAGILYVPAAEPNVSAQRGAAPEEIEKAELRQLRMSGLVLSDSEIITAMEAGAKGVFIPAALKKDGTPDSHSSVLSEGELIRVLEYSRRLIATMGRELLRGQAAAKPNMKNRSACEYCPYAAVCGRELSDRDIENERLSQKEAMAEIEKRMDNKEEPI